MSEQTSETPTDNTAPEAKEPTVDETTPDTPTDDAATVEHDETVEHTDDTEQGNGAEVMPAVTADAFYGVGADQITDGQAKDGGATVIEGRPL